MSGGVLCHLVLLVAFDFALSTTLTVLFSEGTIFFSHNKPASSTKFQRNEQVSQRGFITWLLYLLL